MLKRSLTVITGTVAGLALPLAGLAAPASTAVVHKTVGVVHVVQPGLGFKASQSNNWSGYNQGILDTGTPVTSISGTWVVPKATQKVSGRTEDSATWVGIGGGCLESTCTLTDSTLIQAGTEQDVAANGTASYSTWYEIIPAPSISTPLAVAPGQTVNVSINSTAPEVWTITITNVTTGKNFTTTLPYASTLSTAEWIEETPITISSSGAGLAALPNLGTVQFTNAKVNGAGAGLDPAQEMQLVDSDGSVLATPSAPNTAKNAFNDCTYATTCAAP